MASGLRGHFDMELTCIDFLLVLDIFHFIPFTFITILSDIYDRSHLKMRLWDSATCLRSHTITCGWQSWFLTRVQLDLKLLILSSKPCWIPPFSPFCLLWLLYSPKHFIVYPRFLHISVSGGCHNWYYEASRSFLRSEALSQMPQLQLCWVCSSVCTILTLNAQSPLRLSVPDPWFSPLFLTCSFSGFRLAHDFPWKSLCH